MRGNIRPCFSSKGFPLEIIRANPEVTGAEKSFDIQPDPMESLPSLRADLLAHPLDNQFLVYDQALDRIHLLDVTTARVYRLLNSRETTRSEILDDLAAFADSRSAEALFALSFDELRKAGLLDQPRREQLLADVTRRNLLKRLAAAGATALLIPAITTLTATNLSAQGSCIPIGSPCTSNAQCCVGSNGGQHCHHIGTDPPGSFCHDT